MGSERVSPCRTVSSTLEASTLFQIRKLFESKPQEESQSQMVMAASIHRHATTGQHEELTGPVQGSGDWDDCDGAFLIWAIA